MRRAGGRRSALYVGAIAHRRHHPRVNAFRYGAYWALIDVDELPALDREVHGFGYRRPAVTSFHDVDHFGPADVPVRLKLARWLADRGTELPPGRVEVLTNLRVLGHVFNPVSWWFCHDEHDRLAFVVAEVNNTFGGSHSYLLDALDRHRDGTVRAATPKVFHVSPFLDVADHAYDFAFVPPGERVLVRMDVRETDGDGRRVLTATQDARRVAMTSSSLAGTLLRFPLVTLRTVYLIHRQALRLWRLRTPFFREPAAPDDGYATLGIARASGAVPAVRTIPAGADDEPRTTPKELAS